MSRIGMFVVSAVVVLGFGVANAVAGPSGPPAFGVMEPASDGCPWPDVANGALYAEGVRKCLPAKINWSIVTDPETGEVVEAGVRIVADPLDPVGGSGADGWVVFRCQSKVGLKYQIIAVDLAPHTTYTVTAAGMYFPADGTPLPQTHTLGTFRTDANGGGVLGGVLRLAVGGYDFDVTVSGPAGAVLSVPDAEGGIGFGVYP